MFSIQAMKSIQSQVVESGKIEEPISKPEAVVQPGIFAAPTVSYVPLTITTTISVPSTFLKDIEANTAYVREQVEYIAIGLGGTVSKVEIK